MDQSLDWRVVVCALLWMQCLVRALFMRGSRAFTRWSFMVIVRIKLHMVVLATNIVPGVAWRPLMGGVLVAAAKRIESRRVRAR